LTELYMTLAAFAHDQAALEERLLAAGLPDHRTLIEARAREREAKERGRLELDVEAGEAKVPGAEQFRELLEHVVRMAEINASVTSRSSPDPTGCPHA
jgi:hypothetical protein